MPRLSRAGDDPRVAVPHFSPPALSCGLVAFRGVRLRFSLAGEAETGFVWARNGNFWSMQWRKVGDGGVLWRQRVEPLRM